MLSSTLPLDSDLTQAPSLLLVGDVDFGADPGTNDFVASTRSAERGGQTLSWKPLPGTRDEVAAIKASFLARFANVRPVELTGGLATKNAVCNSLRKHQFLHFSTHGFFAPPQTTPALTGLESGPGHDPSSKLIDQKDPGLFSGLVLAGANRPPEDGKEDGILTALEVGELNLGHVQLATLSACETGLGVTSGAEGLLGLQRAFQIAGARTVLASMWEVPDKATQILMARFYDNLWQKKMSKLDSLIEAQRWMLNEGRKKSETLRGLKILEGQPEDQESNRLPPYYWAAFVLSGDWR